MKCNIYMIHLKGALLSSYENTYERAMLFLTANHVQVAQPVVEKLQTELNPHKATGPVNIPTRFLMECAKDISRALPLVFQVSMHHARRLEEIDGYINLQERR